MPENTAGVREAEIPERFRGDTSPHGLRGRVLIGKVIVELGIIKRHRLGPRQREQFEKAAESGYLVDPTPEGHYSRLLIAWEEYCLHYDLPSVVVSKMPHSGGRYVRVEVRTDARNYDDREWKFDAASSREALKNAPGPWDKARREAMDRFGVATRNRVSSIVSSDTWTTFDNFPAKVAEALAAFLTEKVREHRVPCLSNRQEEEARLAEWRRDHTPDERGPRS
jgi:hypothetical protein